MPSVIFHPAVVLARGPVFARAAAALAFQGFSWQISAHG